jgi:ATP synthase protein I
MTNEDPRNGKRGRPAPGVGLVFDLGLRLAISVVLGLGAGLLLDNWLRTSPVFTLIGMVVGIGAAMYTIWDVARLSLRR